MENNRNAGKGFFDRNALMLTEEDIDAVECYKHLLPEQKAALIAFVYEISLALYNSYFENDEPT